MASDSRSALFMGAMIGGAVGYLLLLVTDFGGWYNYYYSAGFQEYGYVGVDTPASVLGLAVLGLPYLYTAFISLKGVRNPDALTGEIVSRTYIISVLGVVIIFIGAAVFVAAVSGSDDWWFDAGFYGSAIGGIIMVLCMRMLREQYRGVPGPASPAAYSQPYPLGNVQTPQPGYGEQSSVLAQQQAPPPEQASPAPKFCAGCGTPLRPGARFCERCGAAIR